MSHHHCCHDDVQKRKLSPGEEWPHVGEEIEAPQRNRCTFYYTCYMLCLIYRGVAAVVRFLPHLLYVAAFIIVAAVKLAACIFRFVKVNYQQASRSPPTTARTVVNTSPAETTVNPPPVPRLARFNTSPAETTVYPPPVPRLALPVSLAPSRAPSPPSRQCRSRGRSMRVPRRRSMTRADQFTKLATIVANQLAFRNPGRASWEWPPSDSTPPNARASVKSCPTPQVREVDENDRCVECGWDFEKEGRQRRSSVLEGQRYCAPCIVKRRCEEARCTG